VVCRSPACWDHEVAQHLSKARCHATDAVSVTLSMSGDREPHADRASGSDAAVVLDGVVVVMGAFPALAGVDLVVRRGDVVGLRGANGAGKTTVLRLCAALVRPDRGSAHVLGADVGADAGALRRRVGYLGHANGLYDDLTAQENVAFWAAAAGGDANDVAAAMDAMEIATRVRDVHARHLSAGQRRRVALAGLVARRCELWLLDEPHTGLDVDARVQLDRLLRAGAEAGATVVLSSHDLDRVDALVDHSVELMAGQVVNEVRR